MCDCCSRKGQPLMPSQGHGHDHGHHHHDHGHDHDHGHHHDHDHGHGHDHGPVFTVIEALPTATAKVKP